MTEVVFAQLCKNVSSVEEAASKVLDLYKIGTSETPMDISSQDFVNLFYSLAEEGNMKFDMNLDASGLAHCKEFLDLSGAWYEKGASAKFQVAERVPIEYGNMMGIGVDCFDTCSLMKLRSELLELEDLCQVCKNKSVICCSLSLDDLVEVLNDGDNSTDRKKPSDLTLSAEFATDGSTYLNAVDTNKMLKEGDLLAFSVLITNPSNKVKDVELKLHFKIDN